MADDKHKRPFKVKPVKEYGGDVQQMSSPYKEVGFWLNRFAVVDAEGQELTRFKDRTDAQEVVDAMNRKR